MNKEFELSLRVVLRETSRPTSFFLLHHMYMVMYLAGTLLKPTLPSLKVASVHILISCKITASLTQGTAIRIYSTQESFPVSGKNVYTRKL
jgi:hypothetical protein